MTEGLQRLIIQFKPGELVLHALYRRSLEDGKALAQRFGPPPPPAQENSGSPQDTTVLLGPMTTGPIAGGPNRGEVEAVLNYLSSLAQSVTVVGDGEVA
jgi:hypothetical protein